MSAWAMRHVPSGASGARGVERFDGLLDGEVPRHVGDEVLQQRERLHRLDRHRLAEIEIAQPRHAHQPRLPVHLRRARAALARLAVPADRQVGRRLGLHLMHGVEHDHALRSPGSCSPWAPRRSRRRARFGRSLFTCWPLTIRLLARASSRHTGSRAIRIVPSAPLAHDHVDVAEGRVLLRIVVAELGAAALLRSRRRASPPPTRSADDRGRARCASQGCIPDCPAAATWRRAGAAAREGRSSASSISGSRRTMPDELLHHVLQLVLNPVRVCGLRRRPVARAVRGHREPRPRSARLRRSRPPPRAARTLAACSPARLPKTSRSESEFPPSRFAPCRPAPHSPAAKSPATDRHLRLRHPLARRPSCSASSARPPSAPA